MNERVEINKKLAELKEKGRIYEKWNTRLEKLRQEEQGWEKKVKDRLERLRKEQTDIDRLNSMTLSAFFYHLMSKKRQQERLAQEELELVDSKAAYDTACRMLEDAREKRQHVEQELESYDSYRFWESDYKALWGQKEDSLLEEDEKLQEMAERQEQLRGELKELKEAEIEGDNLLRALDWADKTLKSAGNWGAYDMMGGGVLSTHIKRSRMDDAQVALQVAGKHLRRFQEELEDVKMAVHAELNLGGLLSFADYFFDNLFVDWMVQSKIRKAEQQVIDGRAAIRHAVMALQGEIHKHQFDLEDLKQRYEERVENA